MTKCRHKETELGYLQWHSDADRRSKRGEHQLLCPHCGRWVWDSHYADTTGCLSEREFNSLVSKENKA